MLALKITSTKRPNVEAPLAWIKNLFHDLGFNLVRAPEHIIDTGEVIGTREEGAGITARGVAFLKVGLLTEVAHLRTNANKR
jgi:hypothetical protein